PLPSLCHYLFLSVIPPPTSSTLFPYTTLFRSRQLAHRHGRPRVAHLEPQHRIFGSRERAEQRRRILCGPRQTERCDRAGEPRKVDRKSTRLNSSHVAIAYAVFCLKKKNVISVT